MAGDVPQGLRLNGWAITHYRQGADLRLVLGGIFSPAARISVIFNTSSASHENRPIALRTAKAEPSMYTKLYQLVVSIIGLLTLLAQTMYFVN